MKKIKEIFNEKTWRLEQVPYETDTTGKEYTEGEVDEQGRKQGVWTHYWNGAVISDENYKDDKEEGLCRYYDKEGNLEETKLYIEGNLVTGTMSNGRMILQVGELDEQGNKQGPWKEIYDDFEIWQNDDGYKNYKLYGEGQYKNGEKDGEWKKFYPDGSLKGIENWKEGKLHGEWKKYYPDGKTTWIKENYKDDELHGEFTEFHENGEKWVEGQYVNYEQEGEWKIYNELGNLEAIEYYYKGDEISKEEWQEIKDKTTKIEHIKKVKEEISNGYIEGYYDEQGREQGTWKGYNEQGKHFLTENYKDGQLHGEYKEYNGDGVKLIEGQFVNGEKDGLWKLWNEDKSLNSKEYYKEGKRINKEEWERDNKEIGTVKLMEQPKKQYKIPKKTKDKENGNER